MTFRDSKITRSELREYARELLEINLGTGSGLEYTAFVLDPNSRAALQRYVPKGWTSKAHHMTLISRQAGQKQRLPSLWLDFQDDTGRLKVIALAKNDKVIAGLVDLDGIPIPMKGTSFPHVTIAVNPDPRINGKAYMSNEFQLSDFELIEPIPLAGRVEEIFSPAALSESREPRDSKMSEIPIDPNSVKIISPVMYYNDPVRNLGGARLFVVAEWSDGISGEPYRFGFYTSTGTSTEGTAHLKHTWAPTYGIGGDKIFKVMGDKHKTKGSSKFGREEGVLARASDLVGRIIPVAKVASIIEKHSGGKTPESRTSEEGLRAIINARFNREGVYKEWTDGDVKDKVGNIDDEIISMRFNIKRKMPHGTSREGLAAIVDAKLKRNPRYKKLLADRNNLVNDLYDDQKYQDMVNTMDRYGRTLNEGRIKLSEAALRRLVRKLVLS
tara:strand:+ start:69 stop:1394 length:1326 start_codon:yes stop_codon:yes gene_type:complete